MTHRMAGCLVGVLVLVSSAAAQTASSPYFPAPFDWQRRTPQQAGFDAARLDDAIQFAVANENPLPKDLALAHAQTYAANEPFDALLGQWANRQLYEPGTHFKYVYIDWENDLVVVVRWIRNDAALNEFLGWCSVR